MTASITSQITDVLMGIMELAHQVGYDGLPGDLAPLDTLSVARTFWRAEHEPKLAIRDGLSWCRLCQAREEYLAISQMPKCPDGVDPYDWDPELVYSNRAVKRISGINDMLSALTMIRRWIERQEMAAKARTK